MKKDKIFTKLKNKKILVTGGAGFIGSHLCTELLLHSAKVICLDNLSTGNINNIKHLEKKVDFVFINGDANSKEELENVFKKYKIDYIFHYAAVLGVKRVMEDPLSVIPDINGFNHMVI